MGWTRTGLSTWPLVTYITIYQPQLPKVIYPKLSFQNGLSTLCLPQIFLRYLETGGNESVVSLAPILHLTSCTQGDICSLLRQSIRAVEMIETFMTRLSPVSRLTAHIDKVAPKPEEREKKRRAGYCLPIVQIPIVLPKFVFQYDYFLLPVFDGAKKLLSERLMI